MPRGRSKRPTDDCADVAIARITADLQALGRLSPSREALPRHLLERYAQWIREIDCAHRNGEKLVREVSK